MALCRVRPKLYCDTGSWGRPRRVRPAVEWGLVLEHDQNNRKSLVGYRQSWEGSEPFALGRAGRRQHVYILGQTGTGKSTLLKNLLIQDIAAGEGCALIDPHGDLAEELLDYI